MSETATHWINGRWIATESATVAESVNPANGKVVGVFNAGGEVEAGEAISAARRAFEQTDWAHNPRKRAAVLLDFASRLEAEHGDLAALMTAEYGRLLSDTMHEVGAAISESRYYAGLARNIFGRAAEFAPGLHGILAREAIGVAGIIVPWNSPAALLVRSLAPALAAGCTCVVKVAPETALSSVKIFELLAAVEGLPPGVVNLVLETGDEAAKLLVSSPEVDIINYTGSTEVGKKIMAAGAETMKRLNLELGGSAPSVIFADADLGAAAAAMVRGGMVISGQMCVAASRVIVEESVVDQVQDKIQAGLEKLVIGPGDDPASQMGPVIDMASRDRIQGLVQASKDSADLVLEGRPVDGALSAGSFLSPTLARVRKRDCPLLKDEVFGPVLSVETFAAEEEAIFQSNDTRYGLAASVWTKDFSRAHRVANKIQSGTVWINSYLRLLSEAETGGYKESGLGRLHGLEALDSFLQTKHISWSV